MHAQIVIDMDETAFFFEAKPNSTVHRAIRAPFQHAFLEATRVIGQHSFVFPAMEPSFHYSSSSKASQMDTLKKLSKQSY